MQNGLHRQLSYVALTTPSLPLLFYRGRIVTRKKPVVASARPALRCGP
jgi:hypothetical protein